MVQSVGTGWMAFRVVLIAVMVAVPACLPTLAYASPPDPSWILGIYDDADGDDVVVLVASAAGTVGPVVLSDARPIRQLSETLPSLVAETTVHFAPSSSDPRAPPAS